MYTHIEIDISGTEIGDSLRVSDLTPTPGVTMVSSPDDVVVVIAPPARIEEVVPEVEVVEGAVVEEAAEPEVIGERKAETEEEERGAR